MALMRMAETHASQHDGNDDNDEPMTPMSLLMLMTMLMPTLRSTFMLQPHSSQMHLNSHPGSAVV